MNSRQIDLRRIVEGRIDHCLIDAIRPSDCLEDEGTILNVAADWPDFVHGPAQGHCPRAADPAESRPQSSYPANGGRRDDGTPRFRADGKGDQARRSRRRRTGGGSAAALTWIPRI